MSSFIENVLSSAAVSVALVGMLAWLVRTVIYERLKAGVQHEFNEKLEAVKAEAKERDTRLSAELKTQETRLQAELRGRDQQLQLLQGGVLSAMASRQAALDAKRLEAIDLLWASFHDLAPLRVAAQFMQSIRYDAALAQSADDPKTRGFFADMSKIAGLTPEVMKARAEHSPWKAQLYVSPDAWKLFETYRGVLHLILLRLKQLEVGIGKDFTKIEEVVKEVKAALPHQAQLLDKHGPDFLAFLVEELGEAFRRELTSNLNNTPRNAQALQDAGTLMAAAEEIIDATPRPIQC